MTRSKKNKHPLSTELKIRTSEGDQAELRNLPAPVMQALYHQLTGKRERNDKYFNDNYLIKSDDINNLIIKLEQTLEQFQYSAASVNFTIFHYAKDRQVCTSLEKFRQYDITRTDPISSIEIKLDFLISYKDLDQDQNYTISIVLNSYVTKKSHFMSDFSSYGIGSTYRERESSCIKMSIDYVDYVISRSFIATVEEWVNSLDKHRFFKLPEFISGSVVYQINKLVSTVFGASFILMYSVVNGFSDKVASIFDILILLIAFFTMKMLAELGLEFVEGGVGVHNYFPKILINKGDERNYKALIKRRKKWNSIGAFIFFTCIISIIINIIASIFYDSIIK